MTKLKNTIYTLYVLPIVVAISYFILMRVDRLPKLVARIDSFSIFNISLPVHHWVLMFSLVWMLPLMWILFKGILTTILKLSPLIIIFASISYIEYWIISQYLDFDISLSLSLSLFLIQLTLFYLFFYLKLARRNYFGTFVQEGTAKIVVSGEKFFKCLIQYQDYAFDKEWNVISITKAKEDKIWLRKQTELPGGVSWAGIWPFRDVLIYSFQWTGLKQNGEIDVHPKEKLDYISLRSDVYWMELDSPEDSNGLPLTVEMLLTMKVINPYKALYGVENWLETVINRMKAKSRDYIGDHTYAELTENKEETVRNLLDVTLSQLIADCKSDYGVEIIDVQIRNIDPYPEYREATLAKYLAEQEKEKRVTLSEATQIEKNNLIKGFIGEGEDKDIETGMQAMTLETIRESPNAKFFLDLQGLRNLLQGEDNGEGKILKKLRDWNQGGDIEDE